MSWAPVKLTNLQERETQWKKETEREQWQERQGKCQRNVKRKANISFCSVTANFLKEQLNYLWIFRGMRSESLLPLKGLAKLGRLKQAASSCGKNLFWGQHKGAMRKPRNRQKRKVREEGRGSWKYASDGGLYYSIKYILLNRDTEKKWLKILMDLTEKKATEHISRTFSPCPNVHIHGHRIRF